MHGARCIAYPAGIQTHIDDRLLHFRQAPAVAIVEQETPLATEGVLTEIPLSAAGRFAAFDDVVSLTVRAADGDERHGPFLPMRSYEDEAQCDIYLSPSPLLKHYPHADEETPRCGAAPGATPDQPGAPPAATTDRACQQQRQALSHGERPDPLVEGGRPRSRDGALLCPAPFPGAPAPLATHDLIGINSLEQAPRRARYSRAA